MTEPTIVTALHNLGFYEGWVAWETTGIMLWENPKQQPTNEELIAAGWVGPQTEQ